MLKISPYAYFRLFVGALIVSYTLITRLSSISRTWGKTTHACSAGWNFSRPTRTLFEYRKGSATYCCSGNAHFLSRLPIAATEQDRTGSCRLTPTDEDDFVHSIQSFHSATVEGASHPPDGRRAQQGIGVGGLLPVSPGVGFGWATPFCITLYRLSGKRPSCQPPVTTSHATHLRHHGYGSRRLQRRHTGPPVPGRPFCVVRPPQFVF